MPLQQQLQSRSSSHEYTLKPEFAERMLVRDLQLLNFLDPVTAGLLRAGDNSNMQMPLSSCTAEFQNRHAIRTVGSSFSTIT